MSSVESESQTGLLDGYGMNRLRAKDRCFGQSVIVGLHLGE